ncbi:DUF2092 domain-containing protein [Lapillicoccus sp.]|uniref:LolA family protein n=1 Tax=Lapillicoccus sp. TaxID=1909287 RepID=UPI0025F12577|nr:DUF2092 domain-containing protein [Lapillicoccus sp.]
MSLSTDRPLVRWAAPVAAVAVIAGATVLTTRSASADAGLPAISAQQLLVDVQGAKVAGISGTVSQSVDLGLPQLPGLSSASGSASDSPALSSIASGTHTWRVWVAGPTQQRLALVGSLGESDIIRNGTDLWAWSSQDQTAVHSTLPAHTAGTSARQLPTDLPKTPAEAAQLALAAVGKTTDVSVAGTAVVAGRPAYELVLKPKGGATRVAQVRIAVDSVTKVPLRVQVYSTKLANPAIDVGFTSVDFGVPAAAQFTFTPPPGTTVTQKALPLAAGTATKPSGAKPSIPAGATPPKVVGTGWSTVFVAKVPAGAMSQVGGGQVQALLTAIPKVSGAWGSGRLVEGTLFSVVLTDDGRVAAGAVAPAQLYAALAAG